MDLIFRLTNFKIVQISVLLFQMKAVFIGQMEQSCKCQGYAQIFSHFLWQKRRYGAVRRCEGFAILWWCRIRLVLQIKAKLRALDNLFLVFQTNRRVVKAC